MPAELDFNSVLQRLGEFAPGAVEATVEFRGELSITVHPATLLRVLEFLRDAPGLRFRYLADLTALDNYPREPRFEVVYHLLSLETAARLRIKARLPGDNPRIASAIPVWPAANAFEREVFDLFGIVFEGHPFLQRILLPEDWEGHPLRKDYPTEGYR